MGEGERGGDLGRRQAWLPFPGSLTHTPHAQDCLASAPQLPGLARACLRLHHLPALPGVQERATHSSLEKPANYITRDPRQEPVDSFSWPGRSHLLSMGVPDLFIFFSQNDNNNNHPGEWWYCLLSQHSGNLGRRIRVQGHPRPHRKFGTT